MGLVKLFNTETKIQRGIIKAALLKTTVLCKLRFTVIFTANGLRLHELQKTTRAYTPMDDFSELNKNCAMEIHGK